MTRGSWVTELAQLHAPDVVTYAVACRPNAPTRGPFSIEGFEQRQLLKAAGRYRAERLIVATTPIEILALALTPRGRVRHVDRWRRAAAPVVGVAPRGRADHGRIALLIGYPGRFAAVEVMAADRADDAEMQRALCAGRPTEVRHGAS